MAPHSVRACSRAWLEEIGRYAAAEELVLHVHADEQPREIEECLAEHGLRPIQLLAETGCLTARTTVVHATHADGSELDLLRDSGATVCACPTTEADLGDGFIAAVRMRQRGIPLCIGSDSNVRIDPLEELRELEGIARRQGGERGIFSTDELWRSAARTARARSGSRRGPPPPSTSSTRRSRSSRPRTCEPRSSPDARPTSSSPQPEPSPDRYAPVQMDVTEQTFDDAVLERSRERPVVVDFWAEWCGPCHALAPVLESEIEKRDGEVELVKIDVDANQGLAAQFGVSGIPAVKAFRNGGS